MSELWINDKGWMVTCLDLSGAKTTSTFLPAKASPGVQARTPARLDIMVTLTFTAALWSL